MAKSKKVEVECELTDYLDAKGFVERDSYTRTLGTVKVVTPSREKPWWCIHKIGAHGRTEYFVDIPTSFPARAIINFIESI
jgi:hypothetical protein